ncbi:TetR/AcrR family transcriptional regulator [candidate division KSB1 bacterium]|nr:TetR/AcrR family transcriptional regulator [candidate division KSB1 bacterium]
MEQPSRRNKNQDKYEDILHAAKRLFSEQGYEKTSVRQIVQQANTSMGNLYFYFPNKLSILKTICKTYINILRDQIPKIHALSLSPEFGFALDLKIGYINTLENPRLFPLWLVIRKIPEIHRFSLENKKIRLKTFFGDQFEEDELETLAMAIQGIADSFYEQKGAGRIDLSAVNPAYKIIDYSLRLLGYAPSRIDHVIQGVENYIKQNNITVGEYFKN